MTIELVAIAGSRDTLKTSLMLSRLEIATSFPAVIVSSTLRIIAFRVAFVFLAIHLLMYAMILFAVSSNNSAVIFRMPPFFLMAYAIFLNCGSSISGKSASSSTLSNGTDSASTSMFLEPLLVVTFSTLTYCSRLSSLRLNSTMSVLMSSGMVTPIPISPSSPAVVSDVSASLYTLTSSSFGSLLRNPHLTILTNAFTRVLFFALGSDAPPVMSFVLPAAILSSMPSMSSSSRSASRLNLSCNSTSSCFAFFASSILPSVTRDFTAFFLSLIALSNFCISLFIFCLLSFKLRTRPNLRAGHQFPVVLLCLLPAALSHLMRQ